MPSRSWEPDPLFLEGSFITRELYAEKTGFGPKAAVGSVRELGLCTCDLQRPGRGNVGHHLRRWALSG